jgi:hypothetical protein
MVAYDFILSNSQHDYDLVTPTELDPGRCVTIPFLGDGYNPRLHEMPLILPQGAPNKAEMENLARYLIGGGFVIINHHVRLRDYFAEYWSEALVKYGGLVAGQDFWTQRLVPGHPIYNAFFKLDGGYSTQIYGNATVRWGYFVKGRMVGISTPEWHDFAKNYKMIVNSVIYALPQEGSITQRLMQMVH